MLTLEFTNPSNIIAFRNACDVDHSHDITLREYAQCRGSFDKYANAYDQDEYSQRENTLLEEYYEHIRRDGLQPDRYEYDEDGIIIREF